MELGLHHHFYESHHASGPQDNAGKDPRRAMDRAITHEKANTIYDYHKCYEWCATEMTKPSEGHSHTGTWACNGRYLPSRTQV